MSYDDRKYVKNQYEGAPAKGFDIESSSLIKDTIAIYPRGGSTMQHVDPVELAEALNDIIPGFRAKYLKPIQVPQGKYAVVEGRNGDLSYIRRDDGLWATTSGGRLEEDSWIETVLREGGRVVFEGETND